MVSGLLAAIAALVTALFALASPPATEPEALSGRSAQEPQVQRSIAEFRASLQALVEEALTEAKNASASSNAPSQVAAASGTATLKPLDVPAEASSQQSTSVDDDGCETEQDAGEGWSRTEVHCVQQSAADGSSSVSVSSSSSVTVKQTSSDDAP